MTLRQFLKGLLILPPVLAGIGVIVWQVRMRAEPQRIEAVEPAKVVRAIPAPRAAVVPRALAYGRVRPAKVWTAVAQVGGEIVAMHPRLRNGSVILQGEELLRFQEADYRLALRKVEADLRAVEADRANLEARAVNIQNLAQIESRALQLAEDDLVRKRGLRERGAVPETATEQAEAAVLAIRLRVQSLMNELALVPSQRQVNEAKQAQLATQAEIARLDLARTVIAAPFDLRITGLALEETQAVTKGQKLFEGQGIASVEIEAQAPLPQMRELARGLPAVTPELLTHPERAPFTATVRLTAGTLDARWDARIARFSEAIDPTARTIGIVVAVDDPYRKAVPGERPPLFPNMYVEVELRGRPRPEAVVVPRTALHDGTVYIAGTDDRLIIRPVTVATEQGNFAVLASGVAAGERVVVSDLSPAIAGMLLAPLADSALAGQLVDDATGREPLP